MSSGQSIGEALKLTHVAKKPIRCFKCGSTIAVGEKLRIYRERATSSHEAQHEGFYPKRCVCASCSGVAP